MNGSFYRNTSPPEGITRVAQRGGPLLMLGLVPVIMLFARAWLWFLLQLIANLIYAYYVFWTLTNFMDPITNVVFYGCIYLLYLVSVIDVGRRWKKKWKGRKS